MTFLCQYSNTCQYLGILQILFDAILEKKHLYVGQSSDIKFIFFFLMQFLFLTLRSYVQAVRRLDDIGKLYCFKHRKIH